MEMYSEAVLRYYEMPPNKKKIENADKQARVDNPLCGDEMTVYLKVDSRGIVEKAGFEGQGCAISQASASMLLESIEGRNVIEIEKIKEQDVLNMLGGKISPARFQCAFLGLNALNQALE